MTFPHSNATIDCLKTFKGDIQYTNAYLYIFYYKAKVSRMSIYIYIYIWLNIIYRNMHCQI